MQLLNIICGEINIFPWRMFERSYSTWKQHLNSRMPDVNQEQNRAESLCTDAFIFKYLLYFQVDTTDSHWLHRSRAFDPRKPTIFTVHGYAGGDNSNSYVMLRDAFALNGQYNVFVFDYGPVSRPPCYVQMVHNVNYVSFCASNYINQLVSAGLPCGGLTCVGHSIGAHVCGHLTKRLPFRLHKIVGKNLTNSVSKHFVFIWLLVLSQPWMQPHHWLATIFVWVVGMLIAFIHCKRMLESSAIWALSGM